MIRRAVSAISILAGIGFGTSALAGGPTVVVQEPAVYAPVAVVSDSNWTGGYVGLSFGQHDASLSAGPVSVSADDTGLGVFAGYNHDFGQYVLGGELSFDRAKEEGVKVDLTRLKGRFGYDAGQWMPYAMLGVARVKGSDGIDSYSKSGMTFGIGADFAISRNFVLGAELSRSSFGSVANVAGTDVDLDIDTIQLRASWKF